MGLTVEGQVIGARKLKTQKGNDYQLIQVLVKNSNDQGARVLNVFEYGEVTEYKLMSNVKIPIWISAYVPKNGGDPRIKVMVERSMNPQGGENGNSRKAVNV